VIRVFVDRKLNRRACWQVFARKGVSFGPEYPMANKCVDAICAVVTGLPGAHNHQKTRAPPMRTADAGVRAKDF